MENTNAKCLSPELLAAIRNLVFAECGDVAFLIAPDEEVEAVIAEAYAEEKMTALAAMKERARQVFRAAFEQANTTKLAELENSVQDKVAEYLCDMSQVTDAALANVVTEPIAVEADTSSESLPDVGRALFRIEGVVRPKSEWLEMLSDLDIAYPRNLVGGLSETPLNFARSVDFVSVMPAELGFKKSPTYEAVRRRLKKFGLAVCEFTDVIELAANYQDPFGEDEAVVIMSTPSDIDSFGSKGLMKLTKRWGKSAINPINYSEIASLNEPVICRKLRRSGS